jgi:hypothetical protein
MIVQTVGVEDDEPIILSHCHLGRPRVVSIALHHCWKVKVRMTERA